MISRAIITISVDYKSPGPISQHAVEKLLNNVFNQLLENNEVVELSDVDPSVVTLERRLGVRVEQRG